MTDKEKTIKELKEVLDSLDVTNKYRLNIIRAIEYLQEVPVSKDKLNIMLDEALSKETFETWNRRLDKDPVSDDLEEAMQHNAPNNIGIDDLLYWRNGFIASAKWQNEKNKQWLADNHKHIFNNGFEEGFEAGRDDMEEQMMKDAIYGEWFRCAIVLPSEYYADDVKKVKITIWQDGV